MKILRPMSVFLILIVSLLLHAQSDSQSTLALTNADIVDMVGAGLSVDVIKAKIESSQCQFDASTKALGELKVKGVPDAIVVLMISAPAPPPPPTLSAEDKAHNDAVLAEQQKPHCSGCLGLLIASFNPKDKTTTDNWVTKNQKDLLAEHREKIEKGQITPHFWIVHYRENADYIIVWSKASGSRPYTTYTPQTVTSQTSVSGDVNLQATTQTTYYQPAQNEWHFIDVVATVYAKDGSKKYESFHQGNFRWSKPDKDCLEDALNYLGPKP